MLRTKLMIVFLIAGVAPALSEDQPAVHQVQAPAHNPLNCYCRAQGRTFAQGEKACLSTPDGWRLAECQMVINIMSWGFTATPCPET